MHKVIYTRTARRSLRRIAKDRVATIIGSINELASLEDPLTHQNVKAMKGDWLGSYRLRIGGYRAIFGLNPDPEAKPEQKLLLISVEVVGSRGGIYKK
jgi:mRNA-degrading endonuclease RelE of RelBE toxin-antitoxin system